MAVAVVRKHGRALAHFSLILASPPLCDDDAVADMSLSSLAPVAVAVTSHAQPRRELPARATARRTWRLRCTSAAAAEAPDVTLSRATQGGGGGGGGGGSGGACRHVSRVRRPLSLLVQVAQVVAAVVVATVIARTARCLRATRAFGSLLRALCDETLAALLLLQLLRSAVLPASRSLAARLASP